MAWCFALLGTFIVFQIVMFIYAAAHAVVGQWSGAAIKELSVGWGPLVWQGSLGTWPCVFRLLPMGSSTGFYGDDDRATLPSGTKCFFDISTGQRILILLSGPLSLIVIGAGFLLLPVVLSGPQVVVNKELPIAWLHSGVPGLTATTQASTIPDQLQLVLQTIVEYVYRFITWQSAEGWGGYIAWLATCASAALFSPLAWSACFGTGMLGLGLMNLLPVPLLNGGHLVFTLIEVIIGRRFESIWLVANYLGLLCLWIFGAVLFWSDATWLIQLLRSLLA